MQDDRLERVIGLVQSGKKENARELLELILKEDRSNISAWHWYAQTWPNTKEKIRIWEACLRFNPASQQVQEALRRLTQAGTLTPVKASLPDPTVARKTSGGSSTLVVWSGFGAFAIMTVLAIVFIVNSQSKDPENYRHVQPVEYYLYVPKNYSADQEWPLFIGIHGAGGSGLDCWNLWQPYADKEGFILLCPSIPSDSSGFYQDVGETTVWSVVGEVKKEYRVKSRMFFTGFSAGAFFIQGFDYHYPQYVSGLSILSSGVYLNPNLFAEIIPILVVIGSADDATAVQTSQLFVRDLTQFGFDVQYELLPGVGHTVTKKGIDLTIELFRKTAGK